jgi:hypothetical protein
MRGVESPSLVLLEVGIVTRVVTTVYCTLAARTGKEDGQRHRPTSPTARTHVASGAEALRQRSRTATLFLPPFLWHHAPDFMRSPLAAEREREREREEGERMWARG